MANTKRTKSIISVIANMLFTLIFLFALLLTSSALVGMMTGYQPSIFGYTISEVKSGSMVDSGFEIGDFVVTKKVQSKDDLKVGDIISYYFNTETEKPLEEGEDRKKTVPIIHEIVAINEDGTYTCKGSSNPNVDKPVSFYAVSGKYTETGAFAAFLVKTFLAGNKFLFWVVAVLALLAFRQIFSLFAAAREYRIQREVMSGKRRLLDKECFSKNVFNDFSQGGKRKLIEGAPYGMAVLYEYLLFGRVSDMSDAAIAKKIKNKRCGMNDVLCLTYSGEFDKPLDKDEYIKSLPKRRKEFAEYRNISEFQQASKTEAKSALTMFLGCLLFAGIYAIVSAISSYFAIAPIYEVIIALFLPVGALFYYLLVIMENRKTAKRLEEYLEFSSQLPERYRFFVKPAEYSAEEISRNALEIEYRLRPLGDSSDEPINVAILALMPPQPIIHGYDSTANPYIYDGRDTKYMPLPPEPVAAIEEVTSEDEIAYVEPVTAAVAEDEVENIETTPTTLAPNAIMYAFDATANPYVYDGRDTKYMPLPPESVAAIEEVTSKDEVENIEPTPAVLAPNAITYAFDGTANPYIYDGRDTKCMPLPPESVAVVAKDEEDQVSEVAPVAEEPAFDPAKVFAASEPAPTPINYYFDSTKNPYYLQNETKTEPESNILPEGYYPADDDDTPLANRIIEQQEETLEDFVDDDEDEAPSKKRRHYVSMDTRLRSTTMDCKQRYSMLLNEILKYKRVKSKFTARFDTISKGSTPLMRIAVNNKTLKVYYNLDPAAYPDKYRIKDMSGQKAFEQYPSLLRVRSDRSFTRALELIGDLAQVHELKPAPNYRRHDFARDFAYVNPFEIKSSGHDCEQFVITEYSDALSGGAVVVRISEQDGALMASPMWQHPIFGEIKGYMPLVNRLGIAGDTDYVVVEGACSYVTQHVGGKSDSDSNVYNFSSAPGAKWVSVEVGSDTVCQPEFVDRVGEIAARYGIPLSRIEFVVREQRMFSAQDEVAATIERLQKSGIAIR